MRQILKLLVAAFGVFALFGLIVGYLASKTQPDMKFATPPDPAVVERQKKADIERHCAGLSAAKRKRDAVCLSIDCPGVFGTFYLSAAKRNVAVGMNGCLVEAAWGKPSSVNRTVTAGGVSEQWVYSSDSYIYLEDGIVTAVQTTR